MNSLASLMKPRCPLAPRDLHFLETMRGVEKKKKESEKRTVVALF